MYNPDTMRIGQSLLTLEFMQDTNQSSAAWILIGACSASGIMCCSCCCGWIKFILYRRKMLRKRHTARVYNSGSFSLVDENDKLFPSSLLKQELSENAECVICLEVMSRESGITVLPCAHLFHSECIDAWFTRNNFCCICKAEYSVEKLAAAAIQG